MSLELHDVQRLVSDARWLEPKVQLPLLGRLADRVEQLEARLAAAENVVEAARHDRYDPPHKPGTCPVCDAVAAYDAQKENTP